MIAVGIAGAVFLAALVVAPSVVDWNSYRSALAAELSRATGRAVVLAGPIEATLLPSPRLLANHVRLSGPDEESGDLLRLRAVELQVGLLPLLTGHVVVERLTLIRPEILVETDEAGRFTWVMDGAGGDLLPEVVLQRFAISDGTLVWRDREHGVRARIEKIALKLSADSLSGPAKADGSAQIDGVPVRFSAGVGRSSGKLPLPINLTFEAPELRAKGDFVGQYLPSEARVTGRLKAGAGNGRAALAAFAGPASSAGIVAALLAHPLSVEARIAATADTLDVNDLILNLANQRATGVVRARFDGARPAIQATLSAPRLDLDRLAAPPPLASGASSDAAASLPRGVDVAVEFTSDAVLAAGRAVHGVVLKGTLDNGAIALDRLEGLLPGAGAFRVGGRLGGEDHLRFSGTVDAHAANLRDLLAWLDVDAGSVPAGRLANTRFTAKLAVDADRADLSDIDLHLDSTRAHGAARIESGGRVKLDLAADHLDLDAYMGEPEAAESGPGALSEFSGEGRFTVGRLTFRGVEMREVDLTANLDGGTFSVARFSGSPPEPGEFMPEGESPVAATSSAAVEVAVPAREAAASVATAEAPPSPAEPALAEGPPSADNRDSFIRGILDFLGR